MFSETDHLGGKMTKSNTATPGLAEGQVRTVKMLGSCKAKEEDDVARQEPQRVTFEYHVVVGHGVHRAKLGQVVLVGGVIPVPRHNVERGMVLKDVGMTILTIDKG